MSDFHLVVPSDITRGTADTSWELSGKEGTIVMGEQFGDLSSNYYSHSACLGPGTYKFTSWSVSADIYSLSYRGTNLSQKKEMNPDQLSLSGKRRSEFVDTSEFSFLTIDIGDVSTPGRSTRFDAEVMTVEGAGKGIGGISDSLGNFDSFHYSYARFSGDMNFTIFVEKFSGTSLEWSMGGIMFRDTLDPGSRHFSTLITEQHGLQYSYRRSCKACETFSGNNPKISSRSLWLRVSKEGDEFTSFYKDANSNEWNQFGSTQYIRFSSDDFYAGIAVTSHNETATTALEISSMEITTGRDEYEFDFTIWEENKLLPADGQAGDNFGGAIALDGDTIVVRSQYDDSISRTRGSAYVFVRKGNEWIEQAQLLHQDGEGDQQFGCSIALDGDTIVIGAIDILNYGEYSSPAHVFVRMGKDWAEQAKLSPNEGAGNYFGYAIALDGNTIVIGSPNDIENGYDSGSVYVFVRKETKWTEQAKLLPHDGEEGDEFGRAVALDGDTIVIGAPGWFGSGSGSAYVFVREGNAWTEHAKLLPSDGNAGHNFGHAIALDGNTIVVGAFHDNGIPLHGSTYVFVREENEWIEQAKLLPKDGDKFDNFGSSVALDGDTIVVGASYENGGGSGSAYVFVRERNEWREQSKLLPHDGEEGDMFGGAIALDGDTIVIGAQSGSAYTFSTPLLESSSSTTTPSSSLPTTSSCTDVDVGINVFSDDYPEQTSWSLSRVAINKYGYRIVQDTFYKGFAERKQALHDYADKMCLEKGDYEFTINDSLGNGLNCFYCDGYYNITLNGKVIGQGGDFGYKDTVSFSIPFVPSPSASPTSNLFPSQIASLSFLPSLSPQPSLSPSSSASPSSSPYPTASLSTSILPSISLSPIVFCKAVEINVRTGSSPEETYWILSTVITTNEISSTEVIAKGDPREIEKLSTDKLCLEMGNYSFTIFDREGGDLGGILGAYYNVTVDGMAVAKGGIVADQETVAFSVPLLEEQALSTAPSASPSYSAMPSASLSPSTLPSLLPSISPSASSFPSAFCSGTWVEIEILTDGCPDQSSWTLSRVVTTDAISSQEVVLEGNPKDPDSLYKEKICLDNERYQFTIKDSYGDGLCCSCGEGHFKITLDRKVVARGGEFGDEETVSFSIPFVEGYGLDSSAIAFMENPSSSSSTPSRVPTSPAFDVGDLPKQRSTPPMTILSSPIFSPSSPENAASISTTSDPAEDSPSNS